jgi:methionyl aminopeptidase
MKEGGHILATILTEIKKKTEPGTQTKELDDLAKRLCLKYKVKPSFLNYEGYPAAICVSVNDEVVHGLPGKYIIKEGDLVSLDFGVLHKGYNTDSAITFGVGNITTVADKLIKVTKSALDKGISAAVVGGRIGDIGAAVQKEVEKNGFGVVRVLVGHGVGKEIHENPLIPNFGETGTGPEVIEGMTLAIEPMVTGGNYEVYQAEDGWTYVTKDSSLSCHFEHTIYIGEKGPIILTK